ncbi:MAG: single-stranded-DNA-specific exonuclease RecJ, partial [Sediminibacterium sp.]|nr:single-stranded-DNA-specific exonuclease RecJ [Sediminibacterium sp.]
SMLQKKNLLIIGDYDVDGTTSVAVLFSFLKKIHPNILYYIPNRYKEGYGVSKAGIDFAIENKIDLLITVDCGIKSESLIKYALENNIETIICDHHLPPDVNPPAFAILNPKQVDCNYPCIDLCGCGIVFKFITAIAEKLNLPKDSYLQYIDLVAVAIAADIVPLVDENRVLTVLGLEKINSNPQYGLKALLQYFKHENNIKVRDLVFLVTPRINAAGRMDDAKKAVELFIAADMESANNLSLILHNNNEERRTLDKDIFEEAKAMLENDPTEKNKKSTVVYQPHWSKGVIGIVASRLIENFYKPTIVLSKSGNIVSGSGRSVEGFDLHNAIELCSEYLIGFGGHFAAAGLTLKEENIAPFTAAFENAVGTHITKEQLTPTLHINAILQFSEINMKFYKILQKMEPFGTANMQPIFMSKQVLNTGYSAIVKEEHIKFSMIQNGIKLNGIGFNLAHKFHFLQANKGFDIAYKIVLENYNNTDYLKLHIVDIR